MAQETVVWYGLTTLARVRDRLGNPADSLNPVLMRMINSLTDYVERETGRTGVDRMAPNDGHILLKQYINEQYSVNGMRQDKLILNNGPVFYAVLQADLAANNPVVTNVKNGSGVKAGMPLYAIGGGPASAPLFPPGTTVLSVAANGDLTMSQPAAITATQATFEVSGLVSFQWRAGVPSNPQWTDFIQDQFEIIEQGTPGAIRVYGVMPRIYSNMLRATYWAGYAYDWQSAGNMTTHRVPAELTEMVENLIVRRFKRRDMAGKTSEAIQGATTTWDKEIDSIDKEIIINYKRLGTYF